MKRFTLALVVAVVTVCGVTKPTTVSAQEILLEGPLAGAPAVRKIVQYRDGRFSLGPQFAYTVLNHYMHNILLGARVEYNIFDWLGAGLVGYFGVNFPTTLTDHVTNSENVGGNPTTPADTGSNWPSYTGAANFENQVAKLKGMYLAQLSLVPFRGKMSMFEKLFVAIDGAIFVGGGLVHYEQRANCNGKDPETGDFATGDGSCGEFQQFIDGGGANTSLIEPTLENTIGGAFTWGVNFMAYFNNWFAINLEYRMTPFKWNAAGTDEAGQSASTWDYIEDPNNPGEPMWQPSSSGSGGYPDGAIGDDDKTWNLNQSIALGFIFYLPLDPTIGD